MSKSNVKIGELYLPITLKLGESKLGVIEFKAPLWFSLEENKLWFKNYVDGYDRILSLALGKSFSIDNAGRNYFGNWAKWVSRGSNIREIVEQLRRKGYLVNFSEKKLREAINSAVLSFGDRE